MLSTCKQHAKPLILAMIFILMLAACKTTPEARGETPLSLTELTSTRRYMEDALIEGRYARALAKYALVKDKLDWGPGNKEAYREAQEIQSFACMARVALEFMKLDLNFGGHRVIAHNRSTVIINGRQYKKGNYIKPDLLVEEIAIDWIRFRYQGVEIRRSMKPVLGPLASPVH